MSPDELRAALADASDAELRTVIRLAQSILQARQESPAPPPTRGGRMPTAAAQAAVREIETNVLPVLETSTRLFGWGARGPLVERRERRRVRVLIVEHDQNVRAFLADLLRASGCEVVSAGDREAAIGLVKAAPVDVAAIDVTVEGGAHALGAALERLGSRPRLIAMTNARQRADRDALFDRRIPKTGAPSAFVKAVLELGLP